MSLLASYLFAALLLAHALGDFVFQTDWIHANKRRWDVLTAHAGIHAALSLALLGPAMFAHAVAVPHALGLAVALGIAHLLLDAIKIRGPKAYRESGWGFLVDQGAHAATILAAVAIAGQATGSVPEPLRQGVLLAAFAVMLTTGASYWVRAVASPFQPTETGNPGAGRVIGILERIAIFGLVLVDQWSAAGLILAAKSLARFRDLDNRHFAEYYLVGTLASTIAAILLALALQRLW